MSIKEKVEQDVANKSVSVDIKKRITAAVFSCMFNPLCKLAHNKCKAFQVEINKSKSWTCLHKISKMLQNQMPNGKDLDMLIL